MTSVTENDEVKTYPTKKITWRIGNYSKVKETKLVSTVTFEGYKWEMSMYPNPVDRHLSLYLSVEHPKAPAVGWFVAANIVYKLIDQLQPKDSIARETATTFKTSNLSWGFKSFVPINSVQKGYILNDTCVIEIELTVTATNITSKAVSNIKQQKYVLHLETMDAIHAKARSFLKSSSADDVDHVDKSAVKLLQDAVKAEEGIIAKISKLGNKEAEELEAATKEAKELIDQSLDSVTNGILDARCALKLASLCTDLDECVKIHKGTADKDVGGINKKLGALRKRNKDKSEAARKQVEALMGQRVEASKTTHQLYAKVTNEKVVERSKPKPTLWRNLISSFK